MHTVTLTAPADFASWRRCARDLLRKRVPPEQADWRIADGQDSLFAATASPAPTESAPANLSAPREFVRLAKLAAMHRSPNRFALLYCLLWRVQADRLLELASDRDVVEVRAMAAAIRRDIHKMHAFVRFRQIHVDGVERHIAWFEPEHHILHAAAPFFVRRFATLWWAILTPEQSVQWDGVELRFGPGCARADAPTSDAGEELWRTYYANIFNPARLNPTAMRAHMPKKYWRNLPESALIPQLVANAAERTVAMIHKAPTTNRTLKRPTGAGPTIAPPTPQPLAEIRADAEHCRDCPLWKNATQTVFGEGREGASILFVGEQPGDQEDIAGKPFVGPAGRLLDRALQDAGVERAATYVTNAVKHFKFEPRGKRRIHKKPNEMEIASCHQWLERELRAVNPEVVVALGATAARAIFGRATAIGQNRGKIIPAQQAQTFTNADVLVTVHPSYLLRVPDEDRDDAYQQFVADLKLLRRYR